MVTPRKQKDWDRMHRPVLLPVTGFRDQTTRATYLPWSDVDLGLFGYEIVPDHKRPILVYILPTVDRGVYEIRCHATSNEPDPDKDLLIGSYQVPAELFDA